MIPPRAIVRESEQWLQAKMAESQARREERRSLSRASTHYNLAIDYADRRMYRQAIQELETVLAINPNYLMAHYRLASIYEVLGLIREAIGEYSAYLALDSSSKQSEEVRGHLDSLYEDIAL
ncbi:MAG: tetratricopeptide repeat protein [bacterium]